MSPNPSSTESPSNADQSPAQPGPALLAERSIVGILVHLLAPFPIWGIVIPGLLYRFSSHEFTRANAKNALNWSLLVTSAWVGAFVGLFGLSGLTDRIALPGAVETIISFPVLAAVLAVFLLTWLSFVLPLIAMGKAIFGSVWTYPICPDFVRLATTRSRFGRE